MSWTEHADRSLQMFLETIVSESKLAQQFGLPATPEQIIDASRDALYDVIHRGLPLARVMDNSDLVLHAEGPAVRGDLPRLSAFNWMSVTAESTIKKLSTSLFGLLDRDARRLANALDLRVTGTAPGSLYMGFAIVPPDGDLISSEDEPVFSEVKKAVQQLPFLTEAIGDEIISPFAAEVVPDAAERDASLTALHRLSPTGKKGIHTLDITSPGSRHGSLSQRERIVLGDALKRPVLVTRKLGRFTGEVREIDLDARRMQLRGVSGVGSLRCVLPELDASQAKFLLGEFAQVEGYYEADRNGRPRLILVDRFQPLPRATQGQL